MSDEEMAEALIAAVEMVKNSPHSGWGEKYGPQDVWHPKFGWVMRDGKPTETFPAFVECMEKGELNDH